MCCLFSSKKYVVPSLLSFYNKFLSSNRRKSEQQMCQLEYELKRLRSDLHSVRQTESEFRTQVNSGLIAERHLNSEMEQLKSDNEALLQK